MINGFRSSGRWGRRVGVARADEAPPSSANTQFNLLDCLSSSLPTLAWSRLIRFIVQQAHWSRPWPFTNICADVSIVAVETGNGSELLTLNNKFAS